ncbi:hypothetical protein PbJCM13498_20260 [Prolixibacter bellariivorans]|uniref:Bacteriocin-protection protein, YdeI/OmpD-associated family n=1 Tax=Prolixibacter bellariivorans TaxID=314319 RepID=A0A5M4AZY1_9BACT|nr:YdeI/OmpD-associated family protein [Prolixibacter bellariivorans]GET33163.1 hypothetical protein PbJCM13498_20260 [Prolixibacter bellariivorans]
MKTTAPTTLAEWRQWLKDNHADEKEVWLIYHKKHTGKRSVSYEDSVQEALCWGWIDSLIKRLDDDRYARKFTPRKPDSQWSVTNIKRIQLLKSAKRLEPAGIAVIPENVMKGEIPMQELNTEMSAEFREALSENAIALKHFEQLTGKQKDLYIRWIASGKQSTTRQKRATEAINLLTKGKKLGMK